MSLQMYIGIAAGVISFVAYFPYAKAIVRGEDQPERASWAIWALSNALILLSYYTLGARTTLWVPLAYFVGSLLITALSFIYGKEGWGILRKLALIVALVSAIRWVFFENVLLALFLNLAIDCIGYIPNILRLRNNPTEQESALTWGLYFGASALNLLAVTVWSVEIAFLPLVICLMNGVMFALTLRNKYKTANIVSL